MSSEMIKIRIAKLNACGEMMNANIVRKLKRRLRKMEGKKNG